MSFELVVLEITLPSGVMGEASVTVEEVESSFLKFKASIPSPVSYWSSKASSDNILSSSLDLSGIYWIAVDLQGERAISKMLGLISHTSKFLKTPFCWQVI